MMSLTVGECLLFLVQFTSVLISIFVTMLVQKTRKRLNYPSTG